MHWLTNLRTNRSARQTFIVLLVGFLLIYTAGTFMGYLYVMRRHNHIPRHALARKVVRAIHIMNISSSQLNKRHLKWLQGDGLRRITLIDAPSTTDPLLTSDKLKDVQALIQKHFPLRVNYQLKNGQWVLLQTIGHQTSFLWLGFAASQLLLFLLLILLCVWVIKRLAIPVAEFERASKRFGVDLQAPPIAMQGTPEMRAVIASFNEMQARIRRLIMDRTQMLAAISHDLRTPITRLQLRIEALENTSHYGPAEADLKEMERMIASILSFARDYTTAEVMETFDLAALVDNICNELEDTGMAVSYEVTVSRLPYFGRMLALKRAMTNLIENAVKYGDSAEVQLIVQEGVVKLRIRDHGPGIPPTEMEKVFAPFYRVDPARSPEKSGSGLGMAVARDIIRAHGGDITLTNLEPQGLQVLVTLPLAHES